MPRGRPPYTIEDCDRAVVGFADAVEARKVTLSHKGYKLLCKENPSFPSQNVFRRLRYRTWGNVLIATGNLIMMRRRERDRGSEPTGP